MTTTQQIIMVAAGTLATMTTRFLPFIVFRPGRPTPKYILYLGSVLPASVFALLVVYCLRHVSFAEWETSGCILFLSADSMAQLAGVLVTIAVHAWRKNMMLSTAVGTATYMLLLRLNSFL